MVWLLISAVAALLASACLGVFWSRVRGTVADWLREHGYDRSFVMAAWIQLDRVAAGVHSEVYLQGHHQPAIRVSVKVVSFGEIDDPVLRAALATRQQVRLDILPIVQ